MRETVQHDRDVARSIKLGHILSLLYVIGSRNTGEARAPVRGCRGGLKRGGRRHEGGKLLHNNKAGYSGYPCYSFFALWMYYHTV